MMIEIDETGAADTLGALYDSHHGKVSDKWSSYLSLYQRELGATRTSVKSLLEIGIQNGGSLDIWARYFPNAEAIVGCDINPKCGQLVYADPRVHVVVGDATEKPVELEVLAHSSSFDIVIDDGSHFPREVIMAFLRFWPHIKAGGVYIAEDLHCDYFPTHQGGFSRRDTATRFFAELVHIINFEHWQRQSALSALFDAFNLGALASEVALVDTIASISFHNSVVIVRKAACNEDARLGYRVIVGEHAHADDAVLALRNTPGASSLAGMRDTVVAQHAAGASALAASSFANLFKPN